MGYSTLYGDMVGAFAPLGALYKGEVYALARWRNDQALRQGLVPPIPQNVLEKAPSAELSPDQTDEASLGVDYPTLDRLLKLYVEDGLEKSALIAEGFSEALVDRVVATVAATAFKRALEPPVAPHVRTLAAAVAAWTACLSRCRTAQVCRTGLLARRSCDGRGEAVSGVVPFAAKRTTSG